jgi:CRISPR/Cas system-associated exonuclease Cas4 (RecB family)
MKDFRLNFIDQNIQKDDSNFMLDRISPSMIAVYMDCPLAFYYLFIAKIQIPEQNIHLLFGTAVHKVVEEMYNGDPDPARWFNLTFREEELNDTIKDRNGKTSRDRYHEFRLLGEDMVKNYLEIHPMLDDIYQVSKGTSEQRFRKPLLNPITGEPTRIPISGVVDRTLEGPRIMEYKTSAKKWSSSEDRFKVQSRLYSLFAFTETGKIPDEVLYFVLLKQFKKTPRTKTIQVIRYQPTIEDLAEMWEQVDTILDKIEHGHFERGQNCPPYCACKKVENMLGLRY